jgi:butyryl-CoA dehydrogenase
MAGRISIGALAVGLAQAALDASIPYAQTREQFGRPIGTFQGVAFMIADMATEIEARASSYGGPRGSRTRSGLRARGCAGQAVRVGGVEPATNAGIQIHGGYGYVTDYPVERFMRDAKLTEIGEGTSQVQRLVIARQILGLRVV